MNGNGLKLRYHRNSLQMMGFRLYDLLNPKLEGYNYNLGRFPSFSLAGLKERGLI